MFRSPHDQHLFEHRFIAKVRDDLAYFDNQFYVLQQCFPLLSINFFIALFKISHTCYFKFQVEKLESYNLTYAASKHPKLYLLNLPKKNLDETIIKNCLSNNPSSIVDVPDKFLSSELCFNVIKKDPQLIFAVPSNMRTKDMWMYFLEQNNKDKFTSGNKIIDFIQKDKSIDVELVLKVVQNCQLSLTEIPEGYFTYEMWKYLLLYDFYENYRYAQYSLFQDIDLVLFLLKNDEDSSSNIFGKLRTHIDEFREFTEKEDLVIYLQNKKNKINAIMDDL